MRELTPKGDLGARVTPLIADVEGTAKAQGTLKQKAGVTSAYYSIYSLCATRASADAQGEYPWVGSLAIATRRAKHDHTSVTTE